MIKVTAAAKAVSADESLIRIVCFWCWLTQVNLD